MDLRELCLQLYEAIYPWASSSRSPLTKGQTEQAKPSPSCSQTTLVTVIYNLGYWERGKDQSPEIQLLPFKGLMKTQHFLASQDKPKI